MIIPSDLAELLITTRSKLKHVDRTIRAWLDEREREGDIVQAAQAPSWVLYEKCAEEWRAAVGAFDAWLFDEADRKSIIEDET